MNSPFRSTPNPFMGIPVPSLQASETSAPYLDDVPFRNLGENAVELEEVVQEKADLPPQRSWWSRLFQRRKNEADPVLNELTELRANYTGLLHEAKEIRERLERETEERHQTVNRVLSPFPAAMEGLKAVRTRQEEVSDVLYRIRDQVNATAERDGTLLDSMQDFGQGLSRVGATVNSVNESVIAMKEKMGDFTVEVSKTAEETLEGVVQVSEKVETLEKNSRVRAEKMEQDSEDVLFVLRRMERNNQRALWVCALLLGVVLVMLMFLAVRTGKTGGESTVSERAGSSLLAADSGSRVLLD